MGHFGPRCVYAPTRKHQRCGGGPLSECEPAAHALKQGELDHDAFKTLFSRVNVLQARASVPADEAAIMGLVRKAGAKEVNDVSLGGLKDWLLDTAREILGSFAGDWHDAADLYRNWSLQQKWATPLTKRTDVPKWLLDSPVYLTVHPEWNCCNSLDLHPPVMPCHEFVPFDRCLPPLLDRIAGRPVHVGPRCSPHPRPGAYTISGFRVLRQRGLEMRGHPIPPPD